MLLQKLILILLLVTVSRCLDNGLARTPPMGWLAWERFRCNIDCASDPHDCISAKLYKDMADRLVADGYRDAGYNHVNIDDCWMARDRDPVTQRLKADPHRFPLGMKDLVDYVHCKKLKIGMYESFGENTCMGYPGSIHHLKTDADMFAELEFDYLKFDGCFTQTELLDDGYRNMGRYLNGTGRPMIYSCSWPYYKHVVGIEPDFREISRHCNLWRVWHDIDDSWYSIVNIVDYYVKYEHILQPAAGPGHWNDPDMLIIGNFGLSYDQSKAQMALWAIFAAPLLMSNDLRNIKPEFKEILLNKKVLAVNQDRLGIQGRRIAHKNGLAVWQRPIWPNGSYAIVVFNRRVDGTPLKFHVPLVDVGLSMASGYMVEEVFGLMKPTRLFPKDKLTNKVNPSGVVMYVAKPYSQHLESELLANVAAVDVPVIQKHKFNPHHHHVADVGASDGGLTSYTLMVIVVITALILLAIFFKPVFTRVCKLCSIVILRKSNTIFSIQKPI